MTRHRTLFLFTLALLICLAAPGFVRAWPGTGEWIPVYKGGVFLQDPSGDASGSRNIVADPTHDAAFIFNDGQYIYFRLRLDESPEGKGGQGLLQSFGWGVEIDTNLTAADYEWLLIVDGIAKTELVELRQNVVQGTLGDPGDNTETICATVPLAGNHQISPADTAINGDQDYFLDWRFPYDTFKQCTGLTDSSPLRLFFGSSPSANSLREQGGDLVGGSDLYTGFSDYVTPFGTRPTTGAVRFVQDLAGNGDVTVIDAGNPVYVRVDDGDQNHSSATLQTVTVTLTTPSGDSETLVLTETGVDTGVFTGSLPSLTAAPIQEDGTMQVAAPQETVTVTYVDGIDADLDLDQPRTDTLSVLSPLMSAAKTVSPTSSAAGGTLTYTVTITNSGDADGDLTKITDLLPTGFQYVPGSSAGVTSADPTINGQILTWEGSWTVPKKTGEVNGTVILSFQAQAGTASGTYYNNLSVLGSNFILVLTGDTAPVQVGGPLMTLTKAVDQAQGNPGEELIYSVQYHNVGSGPAHNLIIMDTVPPETTYIPGSLRLGDASSSYATATPKTDAAGDDEGEVSGSNIIFTVTVIAPDDGVPGSGPDQGKAYFKVKIE